LACRWCIISFRLTATLELKLGGQSFAQLRAIFAISSIPNFVCAAGVSVAETLSAARTAKTRLNCMPVMPGVVKGRSAASSHTDFAVIAKNPDWLRRGLGFKVLDGEGMGGNRCQNCRCQA
jgi:hypothetical protein